jgi:mono/diheme cytochrome c family protein
MRARAAFCVLAHLMGDHDQLLSHIFKGE